MMVHSSLRSIGHVAGGAETVVDALLESLGLNGTLVVPTFTYPVARDPDFIFDPANTPSHMGAISDNVRRRSNTQRSINLQHSLAAIGPLAQAITTAGGASAWDAESPLGQLIRRDGMFLLLGVPYMRLTAVHFAEVHVRVAYRQLQALTGRMRRPDGAIVELVSIGTPPQAGHPGSDYNRLGQTMEDKGLVKVGAVGNAIGRLVYGYDVLSSAEELYRRDKQAFLQQGSEVTRLTRGHNVEIPGREMCVVDPARVYDS